MYVRRLYCLKSKLILFLDELYAFVHKRDKYMVLKKDGTSCGQHPDQGLDMNFSESPPAALDGWNGLYST